MFDFFDISKTGFIEKEDFIKMLYNYPKKDILKMIYKIETSKMNKHKNLKKASSIEMKNLRANNIQSSKNIQKTLKSMNIDDMRTLSKARIKSKVCVSSRQIRPQSTEFNYGKKFYTTMNHSIKYIADLVYEDVGQGHMNHQMSFNSFRDWVKTNDGILITFDKWLRKKAWTVDMMSGNFLYRQNGLISGEYMKVNMRTKKELLKLYKRNFVELYNEILFIYKDSSGKELVRLVILKNLEIEFIKMELKIKIVFPECSRYKNITLVVESHEVFNKWKQMLSPFLRDTVEEFYTFSDKIGRGTYSTVNKGFDRMNPDIKVAIKTIIKESLKPEEKTLISEESLIIKKLNHENIIKFIRQFEDMKRLYYIFELAEGGDLYDHINENKRLCENESKIIFKQLLKVIQYLHTNHILHRDLKPENIMIVKDEVTGKVKHIKLIDFGFATYFSKDDLPSLSCGTLNYAAPELLLGEKYGEPSDIFSAGVILYLM
jgi:hypothetical protein